MMGSIKPKGLKKANTRKKAKVTKSIVPPKNTTDPTAITLIEYGSLEAAFAYFNQVLFGGTCRCGTPEPPPNDHSSFPFQPACGACTLQGCAGSNSTAMS